MFCSACKLTRYTCFRNIKPPLSPLGRNAERRERIEHPDFQVVEMKLRETLGSAYEDPSPFEDAKDTEKRRERLMGLYVLYGRSVLVCCWPSPCLFSGHITSLLSTKGLRIGTFPAEARVQTRIQHARPPRVMSLKTPLSPLAIG